MNETEEEHKTEKRKEQLKKRIKSFLGNKYNLILIGILIFAFVVYLYYFSLTQNQTLWWDEAEYMSIAKNWAFNIHYEINPARPVLFPFLAFIFYKIGFGELFIKFFLGLIPLLLGVLFTYFLVVEMYNDKKLALIASFILSLSWIHIFYAMRLMTDSLGFLFGTLAFLCFWKGYINNKGKKYIWFIGFFVALSFLSRLTGILYGIFIILFLIMTLQFKFLKNKHMWISLLIAFLTISPYLLWSYSYFGNPLAFRSGYGGISYPSLGWNMLTFVYDYPEAIFFVFFIIGLLTLLPMFLSLDKTLFKKNKTYYNDFFVFLSILFTLGFFIYFLRQVENRWLIMMSTGIFIFSAKGILLIYSFLKKNLKKTIAIIFLIMILGSGAYFQLKHADMITKMKVDSYLPVKQAALWMKDNSNSNDSIVSASLTQTVYYAERNVIPFYNFSANSYYTPEEFDGVIQLNKPKYFVASIFEPSIPEWTYAYPQNKEMYRLVKAWFADEEQKNPLLIVYEINYKDF